MQLRSENILTFLILTASMLNGKAQISNYFSEETGIYYLSPVIKSWATACKISRGYVRIDDKLMGRASAGEDNACLGKADNKTVSLGDSGIAVVAFSEPIKDIDGFDFAVFENSFDGRFLELAFVEVSTDSLRWVRFPSKTLIPDTPQTGTFGTTDPTLILNLAGECPVYYGTPFDLAVIRDSAGIDINNIRFIKIIDVIGCIFDEYASFDASGNKINDPWPTPFPQSGFDLDAVAMLRTVTSSRPSDQEYTFTIYPNPSAGRINVVFPEERERHLTLYGLQGRIVRTWQIFNAVSSIDLSGIPAGIYFLSAGDATTDKRKLVIK